MVTSPGCRTSVPARDCHVAVGHKVGQRRRDTQSEERQPQQSRKKAMPKQDDATWKPKITAGAPWTKGPWATGPHPHGHCRISAPGEPHAIARTYGPDLNGIGVCELTGPKNAADAALICEAPVLAEVAALVFSWAEQNKHQIPRGPGEFDLLTAIHLATGAIERIIEKSSEA